MTVLDHRNPSPSNLSFCSSGRCNNGQSETLYFCVLSHKLVISHLSDQSHVCRLAISTPVLVSQWKWIHAEGLSKNPPTACGGGVGGFEERSLVGVLYRSHLCCASCLQVFLGCMTELPDMPAGYLWLVGTFGDMVTQGLSCGLIALLVQALVLAPVNIPFLAPCTGSWKTCVWAAGVGVV